MEPKHTNNSNLKPIIINRGTSNRSSQELALSTVYKSKQFYFRASLIFSMPDKVFMSFFSSLKLFLCDQKTCLDDF